MTIIDIARKARAHGMTYGQYVAAGLALEPPEPPKKPKKPEVIAPRCCGYCGKELPPGAMPYNIYCSRECGREATRKREWEQRHGKSMPQARVCQNCKKPIDNSVSYRVKYCSGKCRSAYNGMKYVQRQISAIKGAGR